MEDVPLTLRLTSALGIVVLLALTWVLSERRGAVPWRLVAWGLGLQFAFGVLVLHAPGGAAFFAGVREAFVALTAASDAGAEFVFGKLVRPLVFGEATVITETGPEPATPLLLSAVIAFRVLPIIIFVSAIAMVLQHFGIVQAVVRGLAWCMRRTLKTSGAETFVAALLVFLGIESLSAVTDYIQRMTRSELFVIMSAFLATIAASVMLAYASFGAEPGHLLAASVMSAPAAIAFAKILVPETGTPETGGAAARVKLPKETHNLFDAAARGGQLGLQMALNVGAMLIVFVGLIHLLDQVTLALTGQTIAALLRYVFVPFAWLMGVPGADVGRVAELLALKSVFNEFLAYEQLQRFMQAEANALSPRAQTIATYALCGFANPGSVGILLGALATIAPERRAETAGLALRAFVAGTFAAFSTACVAGVLA